MTFALAPGASAPTSFSNRSATTQTSERSAIAISEPVLGSTLLADADRLLDDDAVARRGHRERGLAAAGDLERRQLLLGELHRELGLGDLLLAR